MIDSAAPRIASVMPVAPTDAVPCSARGAVRLHAAIVTIAIFKASRIENERMIQSPSLHSRFEILYKLTGISRNPFNDAGRMRSDTTAESIGGTPESQCRPPRVSSPVAWLQK